LDTSSVMVLLVGKSSEIGCGRETGDYKTIINSNTVFTKL